MSSAHTAAPRALQIVDECSSGSQDLLATSEMLISSLRNWASAFALWNLALFPQGGPAQALGYGCEGCTGVVSVDPQTRHYALSRDYYELAQFSRFIQPGAVRVSSPHFVSYGLGGLGHFQPVVSSGLDDVAFLNPDGTRVVFAYNTGSDPDLLCRPLAPQLVHLPDPAARDHHPAMAVEDPSSCQLKLLRKARWALRPWQLVVVGRHAHHPAEVGGAGDGVRFLRCPRCRP